MKTQTARTRQTGFTLLEVVIAVGLMSIIVGMVFGIARTSLALGNTIVKTQNEEMLHQAFFDFLRQRLTSLPGNTRLDITLENGSHQVLSDLTLQNVPLSFTWSGTNQIAKSVQISTVKRRSGYLDIVLRYYRNEILPGSTPPADGSHDMGPFAEIVLMQDVAYFEWRVLDGLSMQWQNDWNVEGRLPLQLELTMAIGARGQEMRQVFWLPPKANPDVVMKQLQPGSSLATPPTSTPPIVVAPPATPPVITPGRPPVTPSPSKGGTTGH